MEQNNKKCANFAEILNKNPLMEKIVTLLLAVITLYIIYLLGVGIGQFFGNISLWLSA